MPTKQELLNKIDLLEEWLKVNSPEHEARHQIEADLRKAKQDLIHASDGRD